MNASVKESVIIFRRARRNDAANETAQSIASLDDLFAFFLDHKAAAQVDRIEIEGTASDGRRRKLTLVFQSMTIEDSPGDA